MHENEECPQGLEEKLGITTRVLSNGVRLTYKQTDFEKNEVVIQVCFLLSSHAASVLPKGLAAQLLRLPTLPRSWTLQMAQEIIWRLMCVLGVLGLGVSIVRRMAARQVHVLGGRAGETELGGEAKGEPVLVSDEGSRPRLCGSASDLSLTLLCDGDPTARLVR